MKKAFVIMQIGNKELDNVFDLVIHPALNSFDLKPIRVDKHTEGELIKSEIKEFIETADIIVADLTNERPNCYLEVGYTMGLRKNKNLILTCREDHNSNNPNFKPSGPKVHFDLIGYDIEFWDPEKLNEFEKNLKSKISTRLSKINKEMDNPPINQAQIYMSFEKDGANGSPEKLYPNYRVNFKNEGNKSAEKVNGYILVGSDTKIDMDQHGGSIASMGKLDPEKYDLNDFLTKYEHTNFFEFIFPKRGEDKLQPFVNHSNGYISIFEGDIEKVGKVIVLNIENNGFVRQEFEISKDTEKNLEETRREFKPF